MDEFLVGLLSSHRSGDEEFEAAEVLETLSGIAAAERLDALLAALRESARLESVAALISASLAAEESEESEDQVASAVAVHLGRSRGRAKADLELAGQLAQSFPDTLTFVAAESA